MRCGRNAFQGLPGLDAFRQRVQHGLVKHVRFLRRLDERPCFRNLLRKLRINFLGRLNPRLVGTIRTVRRIRVTATNASDYDNGRNGAGCDDYVFIGVLGILLRLFIP